MSHRVVWVGGREESGPGEGGTEIHLPNLLLLASSFFSLHLSSLRSDLQSGTECGVFAGR